MLDLCFSLSFLLVVALIGIPLIRLLDAEQFPYRMLAAPIYGFGAVAIFIAGVYRRDLSLRNAALFTIVAAVLIGGREAVVALGKRPSLPGLLTLATAFAVLLLCLAPRWTGGAHYASFQGNRADHLRYLTHTAAARAATYSELATGKFADPVLHDGKGFMNGRPAPQLVLAAYSLAFGADTIQAAYPFLAALQTLTFFGVAFLILQVFQARFEVALLSSAAVTVGFPMQYIFDINAWGKLAGMPTVLASMAIFLTTIAPLSTATPTRGVWPLSLAIAMIVGSLVYLYPEMTPVYGSGVIAAIGFWEWTHRGRRNRAWLQPCALGVAGAILLCLLHFEGTLEFFVHELRFALHRSVNWWKYFQGYLIERGPVDFAVSALGLYFLLPPRSIVGNLETVWRLLAIASTAIVVTLSVAAWVQLVRRSQRATLLLVSVFGSTLVVGITALSGRYWPAGEAWAMLAPLVCAALIMPLFDTGAPLPRASRCAAMLVILCHLGLGIARPIAVSNRQRAYYPSPYPAPAPALKRNYDWDVHRHAEKIAACKSVGLDINDVFLERTWTVYLTDHDRRWESARPDRQTFEEAYKGRIAPLRDDLDCVVSTSLASAAGRKNTIWLVPIDPRIGDFIDGAAPALDISIPTPPGIEASGLHGIEPYAGESLRWTSDEARFLVPPVVADAAKQLELAVWPFAAHPDRHFRVTVNDRVVFDGPVPLALEGLRWDIDGEHELDIRIAVPGHHVDRDPRTLGIALRRLALVR